MSEHKSVYGVPVEVRQYGGSDGAVTLGVDCVGGVILDGETTLAVARDLASHVGAVVLDGLPEIEHDEDLEVHYGRPFLRAGGWTFDDETAEEAWESARAHAALARHLEASEVKRPTVEVTDAMVAAAVGVTSTYGRPIANESLIRDMLKAAERARQEASDD